MHTNLRCLLIMLLLTLTNTAWVAGQTVELATNISVPNGAVQSVAIHPSKQMVYMSGQFTSFSPNRPYCARLNDIKGMDDLSFPLPNGKVEAVISDKKGGWIVGGKFTTVGDSSRSGLAHIDSNGSVTKLFEGLSLVGVQSLLLHGDTLFIGGSFNDPLYGCLVAYRLSRKEVIAWPIQVQGSIEHMLVVQERLVLSGKLKTVNNQARSGVASIVLNLAAPSSWNPELYFQTMETDDTLIYAAVDVDKIACIDPITGVELWRKFHTSTIAIAKTLAISGNIIYIGGTKSVSGIPSSDAFIHIVNKKDGSLIGSFLNTAFEGSSINKIIVDSSKLYIGGLIKKFKGVVCSNLIEVSITKQTFNNWAVEPNGEVDEIVFSNKSVYLAGSFNSLSYSIKRPSLAALDLRTGSVSKWNPGLVNGTINTIAVTEGAVIIAGKFTSVNGVARSNVALLHPQTGALLSDTLNTDGEVKQLLEVGNDIFMGGAFTKINGISNPYLTKILQNLKVDVSWSPLLNGSVNILYYRKGYLHIGGDFTSVMGKDRKYMASVHISENRVSNWGNWMGFPPKPVRMIYCMDEQLDLFYVSGIDQGKKFYGQVSLRDGSPPHAVFTYPPSSAIDIETSVVSMNDGVYVGKEILRSNLYGSSGLINKEGAVSALPYLPLGKAVYSLDYKDGYLVIGGDFNTVGDIPKKHLVIYRMGNGETAQLSISARKILFDSLANTQQIGVSANGYWTVSKDSYWLTIDKGDGVGNEGVSLSVDQNLEGKTRVANVLFKIGDMKYGLTVTQLPNSEQLLLSEDTLYFKAGQEMKTLSIVSNEQWFLGKMDMWVSGSQDTGRGTRSINLIASENTDITKRTMILPVYTSSKTKQIVIVQEGAISAIPDGDLSLVIAYPNPIRGNCIIKSLPSNEPVMITLLNSSGNVVIPEYAVNANTTEIETAQLDQGLYFLHLRSSVEKRVIKLLKID